MGINKLWLRDEQFARSIARKIDKETLVDLLGIVVYEADRSAMLEDDCESSTITASSL